jgi:hypothetical protein
MLTAVISEAIAHIAVANVLLGMLSNVADGKGDFLDLATAVGVNFMIYISSLRCVPDNSQA